MKHVKVAFRDYDKDALERLEAIQMEICRKILADEGGNDYKIPHSGIRVRQKKGHDVADYNVPYALIQRARASLERLVITRMPKICFLFNNSP